MKTPKIEVWQLYLIPLLIFILNFVYKIIFLSARDISIDEPFTLFYSQMTLRNIFHMLPGENNPPLHFLLMHAWINLFGIEPFQSRFMSLIFGALSSVLIYFIGTRNFSLSVGTSASLLYSFSNFNTYLAQEARVYSLFVLLTLASVYLFLTLLKQFKTKTIICLTVINILLIYSHFFGFWLLLAEYSFILLFPDVRNKLFKPFLVMAGCQFLAYLPYMTMFVGRFLASSGGTWLEPPTLSSLYNLLWKFCNQPVPTVIVIIILVTGGVRYLYIHRKSKSEMDRPSLLLITWFLLPVMLTFLVSFWLPVFYEKYLIFIAPATYLLVSKSVEFITSVKFVRIGIFVVLISGFVLTSTPRPFDSTSVSSMVNDIKTLNSNGNPIVIIPGYFDKSLVYYYNRAWFKDYQNFYDSLRDNLLIPVSDPATDLSTNLIGFNTVFLVEGGSQYVDPSGAIFKNLILHFDSVEKKEYDEVIKLYILRRSSL